GTGTFTVDGRTVATVGVNSGGRATFTTSTLSGGNHTITATYNGVSGQFGTGTATLVQGVGVPVIDPLTVNPAAISPTNSPGVQDTTSISTTVRGEGTSATWTVTIKNSANVTVRTFTGSGVINNNSFPIAVTWDVRNTGGTFVPDGAYTVTASFQDAARDTGNAIGPYGVYTLVLTATDAAGNTTSSGSTSVVVLTQPPTVTLTSNSPSVYGDAITFTANVSEPFPSIANLLAGSTVRFFS